MLAQQSSLSGKQAYKEAKINRKNSKAVKGIDELTRKRKIKRFTLYFWVVLHTKMRFETPKRQFFIHFHPGDFKMKKNSVDTAFSNFLFLDITD